MTVKLQMETQPVLDKAGLTQYHAEIDRDYKFLALVSNDPNNFPDIPCYNICFSRINPGSKEITFATDILTRLLKTKKQEISNYIRAVQELSKWGTYDEFPEPKPGVYINADISEAYIPSIRAVVGVNKYGKPTVTNSSYEVTMLLDYNQKDLIFTERSLKALDLKTINELRRVAYKIAKKQKRNILNAQEYARLLNNVEKTKNKLKQ